MRTSIHLARLVLVGALAGGALASGASGAGGRVDRLLAPPGVCAGADRSATAARTVQLRAMACLVAYVRSRAGLPPLRLVHELDKAAGLKVDADVRCGEFSHTPCGDSFLTVFSQSGYLRATSAYAVGENLAWAAGGARSPRAIMRLWLHSPPHLANLLSPTWRDFGLGFRARVQFEGSRNAIVWATEFGKRGD